MQYSSIQHIVESAHLGRSREVYVAALTIYIDDSGTSPANNVAVAAGWVAKMPTWKFFEREWEKAKNIESDKFSCMHMAEFVDGRGDTNEFNGWSLDKKLRVASRLRKIIKKRALKGFALGVVKKDYDEIVPDGLKAQGFENHYTYAIRRVLGMIDGWRRYDMRNQSMEYIFDWLDRNDSKRREIEAVFSLAEGQDEAFQRYGITMGGISFRERKSIPPLQAADMLAWTVYRAVLNEVENQKVNPIAFETFKDFYLHRHKMFIEGGYNKRQDLIEWVSAKGFQPKTDPSTS
jgi:hypothetical protein